MLARRFITFVIEHTNSFEDAATYLDMEVGALAERRRKYDIRTPPRGSYTGPHLTQEEMEAAFIASLARETASPGAELLEALLHSTDVTIAMQGGTAKTFPLAQLLPLPPNLPCPPGCGGARLG